MQGFVKLPKRQFYTILVLCSVIIMLATLEVMVNVKDADRFLLWQSGMAINDAAGATLQLYVTLQLTHYFSVIVMPMFFALYTVLTYHKIRLNQLYVFMWSVLLIGSAAYSLIGKSFDNILLYLLIAVYGALLATIFSLSDVIRESKFK